jgi:hypothetical protein
MKVTDCPTCEGDPDVVKVVIVGARPTYSVNVADVLLSLAVSPEYTALIMWVPVLV